MCCAFSLGFDSLSSAATSVGAKPNHGFFNCQLPRAVFFPPPAVADLGACRDCSASRRRECARTRPSCSLCFYESAQIKRFSCNAWLPVHFAKRTRAAVATPRAHRHEGVRTLSASVRAIASFRRRTSSIAPKCARISRHRQAGTVAVRVPMERGRRLRRVRKRTRERIGIRRNRSTVEPVDDAPMCSGRFAARMPATLFETPGGCEASGRRCRVVERFANRQGLESQAPGRSRRAEWFRRAPPIHEARLRRRPPTGCINASMPAAPVATPTTGIEVGTQEVLESFLLQPRRRCGSRWDRARSGVDRNAASGGTSAPARRMQPSPSGEVQCQWSSSSSSSA